MANGRSLHIGVNEVDPNAYGGWSGPLNACEADADDMKALSDVAGFASKQLLTKAAKRDAVLKEIREAGKALKPGDIFFLTYSGHGGQVPDLNNEEKDGRDETWCLYDGELIDDELYACWSGFEKDVRIVVLSDSCHSGTVIKVAPNSIGTALASGTLASSELARGMPLEVIGRAYRAQKGLYDKLQAEKPKTEDDVQASVLLISGCQDAQTSMDGPFNGAFTGALLQVWKEGAFKGTYRTFHKKIQRKLPPTQQPNLMTVGHGKSFARQRPFKI